MRQTLAFLVLITALAACDSASPGELARIEYVGPTTETVGVEGGRALAFALSALFDANAAAGPLTYTATPTSGAIAARIDGDSLRVSLNTVASGLVTVTAIGLGGDIRTSGLLSFRSVGLCPAAVPAGLVGLYPEPIRVGATWTYATRTIYRDRVTPEQGIGNGFTTVRVVSARCASGTQHLEIAERNAVLFTRERASGTVTDADSTVTTSTYTWRIGDTGIVTTAVGIGAYGQGPPPFGQSIPRYVAPADLSEGYYSSQVSDPVVQVAPTLGTTYFYSVLVWRNSLEKTLRWILVR